MRWTPISAAAILSVGAIATAEAQQTLFESNAPFAGMNGYFGRPIANAGDANGDGISDIVIGSRAEAVGGTAWTGRVRVVSGFDGSQLWVLAGASGGDQLGASVAGAGDLNGDGFADVLATSSGALGGKGFVRAHSVIDNTLIRTFLPPTGCKYFGMSVIGASDLDADSVQDVVITGEFDAAHGGHGAAWAFSSSTGDVKFDYSTPLLGHPSGSYGLLAASIGDVDGDGRREVVLAAGGAPSPTVGSGRIRVHSGMTGNLILDVGPTTSDAWAYGKALAAVGDIDGDGREDIAIGYQVGSCGSAYGRVDVRSVATGAVLHTWSGYFAGCSVYSGDKFGSAIAGVGDCDGDGVPDVLVGGEYFNFVPNATGGAILYSGRTGYPLSFIVPQSSSGASDTGASLAGLGDLDGDGRGDYAVSCPSFVVSPGIAGRVRVFSGGQDAITSFGTGCPGSGGVVPQIYAAQLGPSTLQIDVTGGSGGLPALLLVGLFPSQAVLLVPAGCGLLVQPLLTTLPFTLGGVGPGNGTFSMAASLPPGFQASFSLQAIVTTPIATSNGLQIAIL